MLIATFADISMAINRPRVYIAVSCHIRFQLSFDAVIPRRLTQIELHSLKKLELTGNFRIKAIKNAFTASFHRHNRKEIFCYPGKVFIILEEKVVIIDET